MRLFAPCVTDGYKLSHREMYANGTTQVYSNLTPRSDKIYRRNATEFYDGKLLWVGAQGAVKEIIEMWDSFFIMSKSYVVDKFAKRMQGYLGGYDAAVEAVSSLWDLGYLPLEFKSLPEGTKVNFNIPVMTVTNTHPDFFWLVNYIETVLSDLTWKIATNATIAAEYKAICQHYAKITGTDDFTVSIQCHDFSMRGMSGPEDAARAGFGHLTQFIGTDTLPAMDYAEDYYLVNSNDLIAISVPATEHAVATSNILGLERSVFEESDETTRLHAERNFMRDLITNKFPKGIVSYVADSYDYWSVLTDILPDLKNEIMSREASHVAPGKLVIRPDSGDPVKVICGDEDAPVDSPEYKGSIELLWDTFGGTMTETGYKLLDSHIGLIYGDSITTKRAEEILRRLAVKGFASGNVVFGVGSYTYQCNTRDTFGFAVKATYTEVNGEGLAVFKDPKTDAKKKSAKGLLHVGLDESGEYVLTSDVTRETEESDTNMLKTINKNGDWISTVSLNEIRARQN